MQRDQAHRTNELLERIAKALEKKKVKKEASKISKEVLDAVKTITDDYASKHPVDKLQGNDVPLTITNDIPGFEGTLDALNDLPCDKIDSAELEPFRSNKELHEGKLHTDDGYQDDDDK